MWRGYRFIARAAVKMLREGRQKTEQPFHRGARTNLVKRECQPNQKVTVSNAIQLNTVLTEGVAWAAGTLRIAAEAQCSRADKTKK
jgi:hypothetical protein